MNTFGGYICLGSAFLGFVDTKGNCFPIDRYGRLPFSSFWKNPENTRTASSVSAFDILAVLSMGRLSKIAESIISSASVKVVNFI